MNRSGTVSARQARRLLLHGLGLSADPARRATPGATHKQIERMGFVQIDTINVVERAHHHILMSRFDGYRPELLTRLLERERKLFEHWTHDAAVIPTAWLPYWLHSFEAWKRHMTGPRWSKRLGAKPRVMLDHVLGRLRDEGPLRSSDFEHKRESRGSWWDWKPQKAALEYLWRTGEVAVSGRVNFHKLYDLMERVFPEAATTVKPPRAEYVDWACSMALERLGTATPREIRDFLYALSLAEVRGWCEAQEKDGAILQVSVEGEGDASPRTAFARPDWRRRASRVPELPRRMRLLSPFEPALHDRARTLHLFGFDYRLECFVPAARRVHGYYVLPVLEGDRLVARLDPKLHRDQERLEVRGLWWEPGVKPTATRRKALEGAVARFAEQIGAASWTLPRGRQSSSA